MTSDVHSRGSISIVIPAYNEEARIEKAVSSIWGYLDGSRADFEIIVVDDGSRDETARVTERLGQQLSRVRLLCMPRNCGKGAAVKTGILAATGDYIVFTDADQSTSIDQLPVLLRPLIGGFDIAMGSRGTDGAEILQGQGWFRQKLGWIWGLVSKILLVRGYADSQCGFKGYRRAAALAIFPRVTSPTVLFDLEVLLLASRAGLRIAEVPVAWVHNPDTRIPYDARRAIATFRELLRLRRYWRVGFAPRACVTRLR